jgi:mannose-6-phosphate isomerase-like protein (cupin superfamily)
MGRRRVVTGHSADGKAVFASDGEVEAVALGGGSSLDMVWASAAAPTFPDDGAEPGMAGYWPPVGGVRYLIMNIAPRSEAAGRGTERAEMSGDIDRQLPGLMDAMEKDEPGMHTSDTVDLEVVLSGEITLELDDGVTKTMGPGDTIIQNGTRHRWHNLGDQPARVAVILLGAHRAG